MRTTRSRGLGVAVIGAVMLASSGTLSDAGRTHPRRQPGGHGMSQQKATFAAGCFWGVEAAFRQVKGVTDATVGYTGGRTKQPTYEQVCRDTTGHAEAVEVTYDASTVSYEDLLEAFWSLHDPTTPNRQGPDWGSQYRSAIFTHTPEQQAAAEASKAKLDRAHRFTRPIVTQIVSAADFYRAEEYHQRYFEQRGGGQCHLPGVKPSTP